MNSPSLKPSRNIIGRKLIRRVMLFAGLMTLLLTILIGFTSYYLEINEFNRQFEEIDRSYADIIQETLWIDDIENLQAVLSGICSLPGIEYADIHTKNGLVCRAGRKGFSEKLRHLFPITHVYKGKTYHLGELHLQGSTDYLQNKIIKTVLIAAFTQAAAILIICSVILWLIYKRVIFRVLKITEYTSSLSSDSLIDPLVMSNNANGPPDELNFLADAVNSMRENLLKAFTHKKIVENQLQEHLKNLEKIVDDRTLSLKNANEQLQSEIDERNKIAKERIKLINDLQNALGQVKKLSGLLPICSHCKKIRDDQGYWNQIEHYIREHSEVEFSHGICKECAEKYYPDYDLYEER